VKLLDGLAEVSLDGGADNLAEVTALLPELTALLGAVIEDPAIYLVAKRLL
jgi:hypothetical protein